MIWDNLVGWTHDCRLSLLRTSCQVSFGDASSFRNKTCSCEPMLSKESKFTSNVAKIPWKIPQNPCYSRGCRHFVMCFRCLQGLQTSKTLIVYALLGTYSPQTSGFSNVDFWGLGTNLKSNMASTNTNSARTIKTSSESSYREENIAKKN
jgi:hypothetical protein